VADDLVTLRDEGLERVRVLLQRAHDSQHAHFHFKFFEDPQDAPIAGAWSVLEYALDDLTSFAGIGGEAALWGAGATSSSDGQLFRASDRAAGRSDVNLHYGSEPGTKFYSHLSDQYGYFSILPISSSESEAPYVLDGLFDHESKLDIDEHYTDTGGSSDHVFGLFALLGRRFAPRLRNLKDRKFHAFEKLGALIRR
jgi:TnpA family transposase